MKRKASSSLEGEADDEAGEPPRLHDDLLAEEILARLPVRAAAVCAVGTLRGILTGLDYWLVRNRRHLPCPRAACLVVHVTDDGVGFRHEFHSSDVGAASTTEPAVVREGESLAEYHRGVGGWYSPYGGLDFFSKEPADVVRADGGLLVPYRYAGTCNGLVLLTAPWDNGDRARGVLFNPASGEEETVVLDLACGGGGADVFRCFCGLGYSPASRTYKALVCARDFFRYCLGGAGELVVVPFSVGAAAGRGTPRTVAKVAKFSDRSEDYFSSLSMDGKVYVLPDDVLASAVLAFDVDDETVTPVPLPWRRYAGDKGHVYTSELMELWGRPCVAGGDQGSSTLWALTPDHRWERRCKLDVVPPSPTLEPHVFYSYDRHAMVHGAWACGDGGHLFVLFRDGRGFMYNLREAAATPASLTTKLTSTLSLAELRKGQFCWGYQPTLVPPATVFGDYICSKRRDGLRHFSSRRSWLPKGAQRLCLEELMETMRKHEPQGAAVKVKVKDNT